MPIIKLFFILNQLLISQTNQATHKAILLKNKFLVWWTIIYVYTLGWV